MCLNGVDVDWVRKYITRFYRWEATDQSGRQCDDYYAYCAEVQTYKDDRIF